MWLKTVLYAPLIIIASSIATTAHAESLTKQQGDAILIELRKIRVLLERGTITPYRQNADMALTGTVKVSTSGASVIGNATAPLTLVEYTDYQCPYCYKFFQDTYPQIKKKYIDKGKLRLIIKDLPLSFHPHSRKAAQAARCAGDQGKFLEMHGVLYKNSKRLDEKYLPEYASRIALDINAFNNCLASHRHLADIDKDSAEAKQAGISGTPTFILGKTEEKFVVGKRIVGAKPMAVFDRSITELVTQLITKEQSRQ